MGTTIRSLIRMTLLVLLTTGCHHQIAFDDIQYSIQSEQHDAPLVVVIEPDTMSKVVSIRSFATGIAHSWDAQPGVMLKQVADVEFPQLFKNYEVTTSYKQPGNGSNGMTLQLSVPRYVFADWHAMITVHAIAYAPDKTVLFDKDYHGEGLAQSGKMIGLGAFGMKSAVRQSSFDAYKKIFAELRKDMEQAL